MKMAGSGLMATLTDSAAYPNHDHNRLTLKLTQSAICQKLVFEQKWVFCQNCHVEGFFFFGWLNLPTVCLVGTMNFTHYCHLVVER